MTGGERAQQESRRPHAAAPRADTGTHPGRYGQGHPTGVPETLFRLPRDLPPVGASLPGSTPRSMAPPVASSPTARLVAPAPAGRGGRLPRRRRKGTTSS